MTSSLFQNETETGAMFFTIILSYILLITGVSFIIQNIRL